MKASLRSQTALRTNCSGTASTGIDDGAYSLEPPPQKASRKRSLSGTNNTPNVPGPQGRNSKRFKKLDGTAISMPDLGHSTLRNSSDRVPAEDKTSDAMEVCVEKPSSAGPSLEAAVFMEPKDIVLALSSLDPLVQQDAANEARVLAQTEKHRRSLAEAGILPVLIEALKNADKEQESLLRHLCGALWNLGVNISNNKEIVVLKALPLLVELLRHSSFRVQRVAAGALRCLAWKHDSNRVQIKDDAGIPPLVDLASSPHLAVQEQACAALWNLGLNTSVAEVITDAGAVKVMVRLVASDVVEIQRVAAGVLRCLAYMFEPNRINIANEGGIKHLCRLLSSPNVKVQQQAAAALGNLTYRNGPNRVTVTAEGGVERLAAQLSSRSSEVQLMAATTLRNLALNEENRVAIGRAGAIPPLITLLEAPKSDLLVQVAAAIWNLSLNDQNKVILARHGALNRLYALFRSSSTDVVYYAKGALFAMGIELERPQQ